MSANRLEANQLGIALDARDGKVDAVDFVRIAEAAQLGLSEFSPPKSRLVLRHLQKSSPAELCYEVLAAGREPVAKRLVEHLSAVQAGSALEKRLSDKALRLFRKTALALDANLSFVRLVCGGDDNLTLEISRQLAGRIDTLLEEPFSFKEVFSSARGILYSIDTEEKMFGIRRESDGKRIECKIRPEDEDRAIALIRKTVVATGLLSRRAKTKPPVLEVIKFHEVSPKPVEDDFLDRLLSHPDTKRLEVLPIESGE